MLLDKHQFEDLHRVRKEDYSGTIWFVEEISDVGTESSGTDYFGSNSSITFKKTLISGSVAWNPRQHYREHVVGMSDEGGMTVNVPSDYENLLDFTSDRVFLEIEGIRLKIVNIVPALLSSEVVLACQRMT